MGAYKLIEVKKKLQYVQCKVTNSILNKNIFNFQNITCIKFLMDRASQKENVISQCLNSNQNLKIAGFGAPARLATITNFAKINSNLLPYVVDDSPLKVGKFSPGMHIPIKDMEYFHKNITDCIYLFAWNHKNEILNKEKEFKGEWFSHVEL